MNDTRKRLAEHFRATAEYEAKHLPCDQFKCKACGGQSVGLFCPSCLLLTAEALEENVPAEDGWRPIESAPRFEPVIMAMVRNGKVVRVGDGLRTELAWYDQNGNRLFEPTHWIPLPAPPESPVMEEGE